MNPTIHKSARDPWAPLRWIVCLTAAVILLVSGWVQGSWSGRWQPEEALLDALAKLEKVPPDAGNWKGENLPADADEFRAAGALRYWKRRYSDATGATSFQVILMCGRAGRMAVHTPEVCYSGAGFSLAETPEAWEVKWQEIASEKKATFWMGQFRKDTGFAGNVTLFWSWNGRGDWLALKNPRLDSMGESFLYKMYISQDTPDTDTRLARDFLEEFLPVLQKTLFPEQAE